MSRAALRLEGLSVPRAGRMVVRDVSLEIPQGEVTALLGPNGAGKSTLVLAVGGVLRPLAGRVLLGERELTSLAPEKVRAAGIESRSSPKARTVPASGDTKPLRTLKKVVLPAPFGPINPQVPAGKRRLTPSRGVTPPNLTVRSAISITRAARPRPEPSAPASAAGVPGSRGPSAPG